MLRDNLADPGTGPNTTTWTGWESPDIWVRQSPDGVPFGEPILGGQPSTVYVRVTNRGSGTYPSSGTDVVQLYWAKAGAGLSWPQPWNGAIPAQGGAVAPAQPVPAVAPGQETLLAFSWLATPNPADYPGSDGHFCLLAVVTKAAAAPFDGFNGPDLNQNVLAFSHVGWRNIHIVPVAADGLGELVVANHTDWDILAEIAFEPLDRWARTVNPFDGWLTLTPRGDATLERIRELAQSSEHLEDLGHGRYRVLDLATGLAGLRLSPGEELPLRVSVTAEGEKPSGYAALRAVQYALGEDGRVPVGGQTYVFGEIAGWTVDRESS